MQCRTALQDFSLLVITIVLLDRGTRVSVAETIEDYWANRRAENVIAAHYHTDTSTVDWLDYEASSFTKSSNNPTQCYAGPAHNGASRSRPKIDIPDGYSCSRTSGTVEWLGHRYYAVAEVAVASDKKRVRFLFWAGNERNGKVYYKNFKFTHAFSDKNESNFPVYSGPFVVLRVPRGNGSKTIDRLVVPTHSSTRSPGRDGVVRYSVAVAQCKDNVHEIVYLDYGLPPGYEPDYRRIELFPPFYAPLWAYAIEAVPHRLTSWSASEKRFVTMVDGNPDAPAVAVDQHGDAELATRMGNMNLGVAGEEWGKGVQWRNDVGWRLTNSPTQYFIPLFDPEPDGNDRFLRLSPTLHDEFAQWMRKNAKNTSCVQLVSITPDPLIVADDIAEMDEANTIVKNVAPATRLTFQSECVSNCGETDAIMKGVKGIFTQFKEKSPKSGKSGYDILAEKYETFTQRLRRAPSEVYSRQREVFKLKFDIVLFVRDGKDKAYQRCQVSESKAKAGITFGIIFFFIFQI